MRKLCSRLAPLFLLGLVALPGCGKSGGLASVAPDPGLYRLDDRATFLELRSGGTFVVHRRSAASIGMTECGTWHRDNLSPKGELDLRDPFYWPSPERFPGTVFQKISFHGEENGDLVVVGTSEWAGTFSQRWMPAGRSSPASLPPCAMPVDQQRGT